LENDSNRLDELQATDSAGKTKSEVKLAFLLTLNPNVSKEGVASHEAFTRQGSQVRTLSRPPKIPRIFSCLSQKSQAQSDQKVVNSKVKKSRNKCRL